MKEGNRKNGPGRRVPGKTHKKTVVGEGSRGEQGKGEMKSQKKKRAVDSNGRPKKLMGSLEKVGKNALAKGTKGGGAPNSITGPEGQIVKKMKYFGGGGVKRNNFNIPREKRIS